MTQHMIFLTEQERDKIKQIQIMYNLKSINDVIKFLLSEYNIRIEDKGYSNDKPKEYFK
jgi:hypothetical protein